MRVRLQTAVTAIALAFALVAASGTASGAQPPLAHTAVHERETHVVVIPSANRLLYDQNDLIQGNAVVSENFSERKYAIYDVQGADDFTVPSGTQWTVQEVDVTGTYFSGIGPAKSENVSFYESVAGRPGALIHRYSRVVGADDGTGSFVIDLGRGVELAEGHYWVSVQVNMSFDCCGEWGWETRVPQHGKPAMWQNPGGGFQTGCTTYRALSMCLGEGYGQDFMFALRGKKQ
jgi:hypothetical protein